MTLHLPLAFAQALIVLAHALGYPAAPAPQAAPYRGVHPYGLLFPFRLEPCAAGRVQMSHPSTRVPPYKRLTRIQ